LLFPNCNKPLDTKKADLLADLTEPIVVNIPPNVNRPAMVH
jgi:hypothetical protein